jgi:hypothetical protein
VEGLRGPRPDRCRPGELSVPAIVQAYRCCLTLAALGVRLPADERSRWQALADKLRPLAEDPAGRRQARDAPNGYAARIQAFHHHLQASAERGMPKRLAVRWLGGWLTQHDDQDGRAAAEAFAAAWADPATRMAMTEELHRTHEQQTAALRQELAGLAPLEQLRHLEEQQLLERAEGAALGWATLTVIGATLESREDVQRLEVLHDASDLAGGGRHTPWRGGSSALEIHIGPPAGPDGPPADELIAELASLAIGLNPGWWHVFTS